MLTNVLQLAPDVLDEIVNKKATCPFIGSAITTHCLVVRNEPANPLAGIEDVRALGNSGGGDLGDLLVLFATGNHAFMRGRDGHLNLKTPGGLFSLEFPGSQGSHAGHSGILEGDPKELDSGRFSLPDFQRLRSRANDGLIRRSDFGRFIAENLHKDPNAKVFGTAVAKLLAHDLGHFVASVGPGLLERLHGQENRSHQIELEERLTKLAGEDNLVGSSGEYGLLFAFLAKSPATKEFDREPALAVEDVESMFVDKRLPKGWETWKKTRADWIINSTALMIGGGRAYLNF